MAFVRFSPEYPEDNYILLESLFVTDYMAVAPEDAVRAYIYGLYVCGKRFPTGNSAEDIAAALNMTRDQLERAFKYWEDKGLVELIQGDKMEIRYLPLKRVVKSPKKYKAEKYEEFNRQLQDLFPDRMLTPNELNEYYYFIETSHMSPEAMLMITKYCVDYKGESIRYPYILTVARNWAGEGALTVDAVESRLRELDADSEDMADLYRALGRKGIPTIDDKQEYFKWIKSWGFNKESILYAASSLKGKASILRLDKLLDEYFQMDIFDLKDMEAYEGHRRTLNDIAVTINKALGLYYETLDNEIKTYIAPWYDKGYDGATLKVIADYCFKASIRRLEGMNEVIGKFYKLGLLTSDSINDYINNLIRNDERIKAILERADVRKSVTASDRSYYRVWSEEWNFSDDMILLAAEFAAGRSRAFSYINKILSNWKQDGVDTPEKAAASKPDIQEKTADKGFSERSYSKDELNALFDDIDSLDV